MLSATLVIVAGLVWIGVLFGVALWGERRFRGDGRAGAIAYTLALAVYCTSWTFYGTVAQAERHGWWIPPTFVGTILLFWFAFPFLARLAAVARETNATSLADLIAARCGKSPRLAALVTAVALLGMVPYIALQLRSVAQTFGMLTRGGEAAQAGWEDVALWVAVAMAAFAMLFGTRRAAATEHNRGLVLAMAFESAFKLVAMLAVGAFALFIANDGPVALAERAAALPEPTDRGSFLALVVLGALAMFTLPHQFHIGLVELRNAAHLRVARWGFPAYLLAITVPILPLAWAGGVAFQGQLSPDLYVLGLPLAAGASELALLTFLGGVSAATGMVIMAAITLSIMLGNHAFAPLMLRAAQQSPPGSDLTATVLRFRRVAIVLVFALAYGYSLAVGETGGLADLGALSFSALAQLAPAVVVAVWWPGLAARAVAAGILAGVALWVWLLIVPLIGSASDLVANLPGWLRPESFLGLAGLDPLTRGLLLSLALNVMVVVGLARRARAVETDDARTVPLVELAALARRFLPEAETARLLRGLPPAAVPAPAALVAEVERAIAAVVGSASARLLVAASGRNEPPPLATVAELVGEAAARSRFNQSLLEAALENMSQGISVVDRELRLVAWNGRYAGLFDYPAEILEVGTPVESLVRLNAKRGWLGDGDREALVRRRLAHMEAGTPYLTERRLPDGRVIEIRGNPMPDGGFVATFTDVTRFRETEAELRRVNETLEQRVVERTAESEAARREAEQANRAKGRFLAAVGHDLMQPIHAAQLLAASLESGRTPSDAPAQIGAALDTTATLIDSLLEMSRLESGTLSPRIARLRVDEVLAPLAQEAAVIAAASGLAFRHVRCGVMIETDPVLLRRIVQNFLSNALRYTTNGTVLLGARRVGATIRIEVHDTGPGLAADEQRVVFEEFRRLGRGHAQGLGLGLAITRRLADLLGHPIGLHSRVGVGSVFAVTVPLATVATDRQGIEPVITPLPTGPQGRVLLVDDDPAVRSATEHLLAGEGLDVVAADDLDSARERLGAALPALALLDFHLAEGATGLDLALALGLADAGVPVLIVSADRDPAVRAAVEAAGFGFAPKPLKPLALRTWLRHASSRVAR
jgi:Na+/proline symporter/signal transduction histidine kinase/CheY-like chemotaxis protein